jgi:hypothetical protein
VQRKGVDVDACVGQSGDQDGQHAKDRHSNVVGAREEVDAAGV